MDIDANTGLLNGAQILLSPNCDDRPVGSIVNLLVVHGISLPPGEFGGDAINAFFTNTLNFSEHPYFQEIKDLRVSAHLLVRRDGGITQYVPFNKRAWHAGESCFQGRERCNDYSIGIELEGTDTVPYEAVQYLRLAELAQALMRVYPEITHDRMVGHSDVAPGRKTDPGAIFDWNYFYKLLADSSARVGQ